MTDMVFSVSALNKQVGDMVAANFSDIHVRGEISGLKRAASGHLYFTLKDEKAAVSCVMFRFHAESLMQQNPAFRSLYPRLKDGLQVVVLCSAAVYERDGRYQLYVRHIREDGLGSLLEKKEMLRQHYLELGYFDDAVKHPVPFLPRRIGVVSSSTGAVIHDIHNVIARRFPAMLSHLELKGVRVQGEGAAEEIATAIRAFDREQACDVLIVARGGGSIEDLWCFNEVPVIEAIHDCSIPIISAIGHETDWTIADFVSDMRAPTPSAAAELAVPEYAVLRAGLDTMRVRLSHSLRAGVDSYRARLELMMKRAGFRDLEKRVLEERFLLDSLGTRLDGAMQAGLSAGRQQLKELGLSLTALDPRAVMDRGYAIIRDGDGRILTGCDALCIGRQIQIVMADGEASATVDGVRKDK